MSKMKELVLVSPEEKQKAREQYGKTQESIEEDMNIIKEWMKKQPHLPEINDDVRLESLLLRNKFRIEKTKVKIDNYFTLRGIYPEFLEPFSDENMFSNIMKGGLYVPMPEMTDKQERVMVYQIFGTDPDHFNMFDWCSYIIMLADLSMSHDYCIGERIIKDWKGMTMGHLKKMEPSAIAKMLKLHQQAYSSRIISFEYINCPPFMDLLLQLFKPIFKEKIYNRITIHKDMESLHKAIPKKYLPKDLGGEKESLMDLHEEWKKEIKHQQKFLVDNAKIVSNEKLRVGKVLFESELYGTEGTFKKLNLD